MAERVSISGTGNVVRRANATGPIVRDGAAPTIGTDTLSTTGPSAPPATGAGLSSQDQQGLNSLSTGVKQLVTTYGINDGQPDAAKQDQIKQNLTNEIHQLVPGGIYLIADKGSSWSISDLTNLYNVLSAMPPGDRAQLAGCQFIRSHDASTTPDVTAAVRQEYGNDAAQLMGQMGLGGQSHAIGNSSPSLWQRITNSIGSVFVHAVEKFDNVFHVRLLSDSTLARYDGQPQRAVILTDTGSNLVFSSFLWAHEIGHQMQLTDGRWNPDNIAQFSQLSGWTDTYASGKTQAFDGIDAQTGNRLEFASKGVTIQATDPSNFVSAYASTNPDEDFAQSYAYYLLNPGELMQKAPSKFLFINASSRKYTSQQVAQFAKDAKINLSEVVNGLVTGSHLHQQVLDNIVSVNGVGASQQAIEADAATALSSASPLMQAWGQIVSSFEKDPQGTASALNTQPESVVGSAVWGKLSTQDQKMLSDPGFMQGMVASLGKGSASATSGVDATELAEQRQATNAALHDLLEDSTFRHALVANPAQVLSNPRYANLPPEVVSAMTDPANAAALKQLCAAIDKLQSNATGDKWDTYVSNVDKLTGQMTPENFAAFADGLNNQKHPDTAAKVVTNAIQTGNVIYPGDGITQAGM